MPRLSNYILTREPTAIRMATLQFAKRHDNVKAINVAIGNVSLPMHPLMIERLRNPCQAGSPFANGQVKYVETVGTPEARQAFLNFIAASGFDTSHLHAQITDGGSNAMEIMLLACCGQPGADEAPLMVIDASYTNYRTFAQRLGRKVVSFSRHLNEDGEFTLPDIKEIEAIVEKSHPHALLIIPFDNPTGQVYSKQMMLDLAKLCVRYDMWLVSDEAYRELYYNNQEVVSVWGISEEEVPGITGRRVSIETASKVWNACGLRVGALVTDNEKLHYHCVAEYTVNLCANHIGQWIFSALAELSPEEIRQWFAKQRAYYGPMIKRFVDDVRQVMPQAIVGNAHAALYSVVDFRRMVGPDFDIQDFASWCASEGKVRMGQEWYTLLTAPLPEFYDGFAGDLHDCPGRTQLRVAFVEKPEVMHKVSQLLADLLKAYLQR